MFLKFYGLREQPFGVTPDPRFLYFGEVHREAVASLVYGVEAGLGFTSLIAEPGTGKTTLLYYLLAHYRATARTAFIFDTQCNSRELLRNLLLEFEIGGAEDDSAGLLNQLKEFLVVQARTRRRVLLVLDEAQNLDDSVLETVRLLSNFETAGSKLLHIILSGQPQLAEKLSRPSLLNVRQRITIATRLRPFAPVEVVKYVAHRLNVAGYRGKPLFTPAALEALARLSGGVPREINRLCFSAMSMGCALERGIIDAEILREVANDFDFSALFASTPAPKSFDIPPVELLEQVFAEALERAQQAAVTAQMSSATNSAVTASVSAGPAATPSATAAAANPVTPASQSPRPEPAEQERRNPVTSQISQTVASKPAAAVSRPTRPPVLVAVRTSPARSNSPATVLAQAAADRRQPVPMVPLQSWISREEARRRQHKPALIAAALVLLAAAAVAIQLLPPPGAAAAPEQDVVQPAPAADRAPTVAPQHSRNARRRKAIAPRSRNQQLPADDSAPLSGGETPEPPPQQIVNHKRALRPLSRRRLAPVSGNGAGGTANEPVAQLG